MPYPGLAALALGYCPPPSGLARLITALRTITITIRDYDRKEKIP